MAAVGGLFAGGFGSIFSSVLSLVGSFIGGGQSVQAPPPVYIPPATPQPDLVKPEPAATLLSQEQRNQLELTEKRKLALSKNASSQTNNLSKGAIDEPLLDKPVLLGR